VCIALCTIVAHNIAQNRPDSFPPYPPDNHQSSDDVYLREGGAAKLDHSRVLVTKFHQNWSMLKGRSAGQRHTHTHRQTNSGWK